MMRRIRMFLAGLVVLVTFGVGVEGASAETWRGTSGNDTHAFPDTNDFGYGYEGSDSFYFFGGSDIGSMGAGNDYAFMGSGSDAVEGNGGHDELHGESGNHDQLFGNNGDDELWDNDGNFDDKLDGGTGDTDTCHGDWNTANNNHDSLIDCEIKYWKYY
jgi:hypothetical protein